MAKRIGEAAKAKAMREDRDRALHDAVVDGATRLRKKLDQAAELAAEKLVECVQGKGPVTVNGTLDAAYVTALRLALQAGGALSEKVDHTTNGKDLPAMPVMTVPPKDAG